MQIRPEAAYLYDAVWLYAKAADQVLREGGSLLDGRRIIAHIQNQTYQSKLASYLALTALLPWGKTNKSFRWQSNQEHEETNKMKTSTDIHLNNKLFFSTILFLVTEDISVIFIASKWLKERKRKMWKVCFLLPVWGRHQWQCLKTCFRCVRISQ